LYGRQISVGTSEQSYSHFYLTCEIGCWWLISLWCNDFKSWVKYTLVKTRCTCSCGMVLMMHVSTTPFPTTWNSDCEGNHRQRRVYVASRALTPKIPSTPLVTITWMQHTWCPRFRRGTFGYGITTSPTREVEYEYRVLHVNAS
jgi:hypothetical protein